MEHKIVDKAGAWYSFDGNRIGQGRENVKRYLAENPEILNRIEAMLMESIRPEPKKEEQEERMEHGIFPPEDPADFLPQIGPETGEIIE